MILKSTSGKFVDLSPILPNVSIVKLIKTLSVKEMKIYEVIKTSSYFVITADSSSKALSGFTK